MAIADFLPFHHMKSSEQSSVLAKIKDYCSLQASGMFKHTHKHTSLAASLHKHLRQSRWYSVSKAMQPVQCDQRASVSSSAGVITGGETHPEVMIETKEETTWKKKTGTERGKDVTRILSPSTPMLSSYVCMFNPAAFIQIAELMLYSCGPTLTQL